MDGQLGSSVQDLELAVPDCRHDYLVAAGVAGLELDASDNEQAWLESTQLTSVVVAGRAAGPPAGRRAGGR